MREVIEYTPMSEAEVERWHDVSVRVCVAVMAPRVFEGTRIDPNGGSGVLVRLGSRDFVFTAGHVVRDDDRKPYRAEELAMQFPRRDDLFLPVEPGKAVRDVWSTYEPDVAVIELDPRQANYWRNHRAITSDRFVSPATMTSRERFLVMGVPAEEIQEGPSPVPPTIDGKTVTLRREVRGVVVPVATSMYRDVANPHAPSDQRCFHIGWDHIAHHDQETPRRIRPHGVSGGPVLAVDRDPIQLVGLVRSTFDSKYLLCEPLTFALRLLLQHQDQAVRNEALSALVRLEASAPSST